LAEFGIGQKLGSYTITGRLGSGGMGLVFCGRHDLLGVDRAIKVLPPNLAWQPEYVTLFRREARLAARLHHPNIVHIFDVADEGDWHYLVMPLLPGQPLGDILKREARLDLPRAIRLLTPLAEALDYAHRQGVVHRDLKPQNTFVSPDDHVTLMDFGIARAIGETHLGITAGLGTIAYMAPEVFTTAREGLQPEALSFWIAADLYSLGVMAYQILTGSPPFTGSRYAVEHGHLHVEPAPLRTHRPELPVTVEHVVLRMLAKAPAARFGSAAAFVRELQQAALAAEAGELAGPARRNPPRDPTREPADDEDASQRTARLGPGTDTPDVREIVPPARREIAKRPERQRGASPRFNNWTLTVGTQDVVPLSALMAIYELLDSPEAMQHSATPLVSQSGSYELRLTEGRNRRRDFIQMSILWTNTASPLREPLDLSARYRADAWQAQVSVSSALQGYGQWVDLEASWPEELSLVRGHAPRARTRPGFGNARYELNLLLAIRNSLESIRAEHSDYETELTIRPNPLAPPGRPVTAVRILKERTEEWVCGLAFEPQLTTGLWIEIGRTYDTRTALGPPGNDLT
jgi:serine/threonine protein kinase